MSRSTPPSKVVMLTPSVSRAAGGLFNSVRRTAIELHRLGIGVDVVAPRDAHTTSDIQAWLPLQPVTFKSLGPAKFGFHPDLRLLVTGGSPDVIHQHGLWTYASFISSSTRGTPVVISPRGMLDHWALSRAKWKKEAALRLFEGANLHRAACFHVLNEDEAATIRGLGLTAPVAIIGNGADLPGEQEISDAPRPQYLPLDGRKSLVFLGRIHPKKGLQELIEAWRMLQVDSPALFATWRLVIAGWDDGGYLKDLRKSVNEHGLGNDVLFPGPVFYEHKHALLSNADAFILPSYSEGLPVAVLEAWAYKLPVLMTRECNLPFAFGQGAAIEITNVPSQLKSKLMDALPDPKLDGLGSRGRVIVADRFAWRRLSEMHLHLYEWILGRQDRPSFVHLS